MTRFAWTLIGLLATAGSFCDGRTALGQVPEATPAVTKPRFSGIEPRPGESFAIVGPDISPAPILYPAKPQPQEKLAAEQLARYLGQISGREFAAAAAVSELPPRAILVGDFQSSTNPPARSSPNWPPPDGSLSREGFLIRADRQRLNLRGGSSRATLYAVFALLEEQLGCRWWSFNEEFVPSRETLAVAAQDTHIEPAFRIHDLFNREGQTAENLFCFKRRGESGMSFTSVHNLCPMLQPHAEKHPEFLPMNKDGRREFNNVHMNYTAAGMSEIVAAELVKELARRQDNKLDFLYFAGMGDWYDGMDLSFESRRIYDAEAWTDPDGRLKPGYCATMLQMVNRAAELFEKEQPGAIVATHAYMSLEAPPAKTRPRANVVVEIPRLRHDTVRSIEESEKNQSFRRNLDRWCELAPGRVYIWEYGANFNNFLQPFPCLRSIAANLRYYHRAGVAGVRIQGNYVSHGGDLAVLKNYVWGKLLWDPTRDTDELIREFCEGYYGPAAAEMIAYVELLEGAVRGDTPVSADEFDKQFEKWLRPEILREADSLLTAALAKTAGNDSDPHFRRVQEARASLEAYRLWSPGELVERDERLIRVDLGGDSLPRAVELLKYSRNASPKERGEGRAYRMSFLPLHGGPLPTLRSGEITVKIAPLQGGQIRSLMLGDAIALDDSRDLPSPGPRLYELTSREDNRVTMQAELGIENWSPATKQIATRTIELTGDGLVLITGSIQPAAGSRELINTPTVHSVFHCGDSPEKIAVEYLDADGRWQPANVVGNRPRVELPLAEQLRISRRDRGLVIHDTYRGPNKPTGVLEFIPATQDQAAQVRLTILLGSITLAADHPTTYLERELRVTRLK